VLVVAHRGFHPHGDENTIAAFRRAQAIGADMVELDVQQTADGELVVLHDDCWNGTPLGDLDLAALRRSVPAGVAPRLEDALASVDVPVLVEIKNADPERVLRVARDHAKAFLVLSFDAEVVRTAAAGSDVACGLILSADDVAASAEDPGREALARARVAEASFLAIQKDLATTAVLAVIAAGLGPPFVWDADDPPTLEALARDVRVAAVVTNRPDLAIRARELAGEPPV
jgi:glycerophosphoryl diester phosphodiesterase